MKGDSDMILISWLEITDTKAGRHHKGRVRLSVEPEAQSYSDASRGDMVTCHEIPNEVKLQAQNPDKNGKGISAFDQ